MPVRLDPTVLDQLRTSLGLTSFEQVGVKLGRSGHTVRNWHKGLTVPATGDLVILQSLTGRPYGTMLIINESEAVESDAA